MKICIIGTKTNGATIELIKKQAEKIGEVDCIPIEEISLLIDNGISFTYKYNNITEYDAIIFKVPKSKYSLAALIIEAIPEKVILLNSPRCFYSTCSKIPFYERLSHSGVNVPKSIFADNPQATLSGLKLLRFPVMIKVPTGKKKVMLANSEQEVKSMMDALQVLKQPIILEEYYPEAEVIQVFVLGNEIIASIKRKPESINYLGGKLKETKINRKIENIALDVTEIFNTEFARVDFLNTAEPTVIDINICPNLYEASKICNVDIAKKLVSYVKEKFDEKNHIPNIAENIKKAFRDVI